VKSDGCLACITCVDAATDPVGSSRRREPLDHSGRVTSCKGVPPSPVPILWPIMAVCRYHAALGNFRGGLAYGLRQMVERVPVHWVTALIPMRAVAASSSASSSRGVRLKTQANAPMYAQPGNQYFPGNDGVRHGLAIGVARDTFRLQGL